MVFSIGTTVTWGGFINAGHFSDMAGGVPLRSAARIQAAVMHVLVLRSRDEDLVRYIRVRLQALRHRVVRSVSLFPR